MPTIGAVLHARGQHGVLCFPGKALEWLVTARGLIVTATYT
jgi:hypothetical protein